jgi:hypothetical protein
MIIERIPYSALTGDVGSQVGLVKNSLRRISRNAGKADVSSRTKMPTRTNMAKIPQVKKNARMEDSLRFRSARLVMVFSDSLFLSLLILPIPQP